MTAKNAFYAQSGGVTAVINASACGVIETARKHSDKIANVYAGRNGIIGALTEDLIDTSKESDADIAALKNTPDVSCFPGQPKAKGQARFGAVNSGTVRADNSNSTLPGNLGNLRF